MISENELYPLPRVWEVAKAYREYLDGGTLRSIAKTYGVTHALIRRRFIKAYGPRATDPTAVSLIKSLLRDYPYSLESYGDLEKYLGSNDKHRAKATMNSLTRRKTVFSTVSTDMVREPLEPWDYLEAPRLKFLRLPLYSLWLDGIVGDLEEIRAFWGSQEATKWAELSQYRWA